MYLKIRRYCFIGHRERIEFILAQLLKSIGDISWNLGLGNDWYIKREKLFYKGNGIFGEEYARALSEALISLGLLSRIIPEMHTTCTFEIPACGNGLGYGRKSRNPQNIFSENEAIFIIIIKNYSSATKAMIINQNHKRSPMAGRWQQVVAVNKARKWRLAIINLFLAQCFEQTKNKLPVKQDRAKHLVESQQSRLARFFLVKRAKQ